jgi:hypothetical protein
LQLQSQRWKNFPSITATAIMRFFSQAQAVSLLIPETSTVAAARDGWFWRLFDICHESWPAECNGGEHDE